METEIASDEGPPKVYTAYIQVAYLPLALDDTLKTLLHRQDDDAYHGMFCQLLHEIFVMINDHF